MSPRQQRLVELIRARDQLNQHIRQLRRDPPAPRAKVTPQLDAELTDWRIVARLNRAELDHRIAATGDGIVLHQRPWN